MLFSGSRSRHKDASLEITTGTGSDENLTQVHTVKYLGVELDEHLSFERHMDKLCGKVKARTVILWQMRSFIS